MTFSSSNKVWSLKKSFKIFAFSTSSEYTRPFFSCGGIVEVELGEMNVFKTVHYCLDDRVSDFNLFERESMYDVFALRIIEVTKTSKLYTVSLCICSLFFLYMLFYAYVYVS